MSERIEYWGDDQYGKPQDETNEPIISSISTNGMCPVCGCEIEVHDLSDWGNCTESEQQCLCCDWRSYPYVDCE